MKWKGHTVRPVSLSSFMTMGCSERSTGFPRSSCGALRELEYIVLVSVVEPNTSLFGVAVEGEVFGGNIWDAGAGWDRGGDILEVDNDWDRGGELFPAEGTRKFISWLATMRCEKSGEPNTKKSARERFELRFFSSCE